MNSHTVILLKLLIQELVMGSLGFFLMYRRSKGVIEGLSNIPKVNEVTRWILFGIVLWLISTGIFQIFIKVCLLLLPISVYNWMAKVSYHYAVANIFTQMHSEWNILLLLVLVIVVAPICEEFLFRGWLDGAISKRMGDLWGISFSAFIFALAHFVPLEFPALLLIGVCLSIAKRVNNSQFSNITIHSVINTISLIFILCLRK